MTLEIMTLSEGRDGGLEVGMEEEEKEEGEVVGVSSKLSVSTLCFSPSPFHILNVVATETAASSLFAPKGRN